MEIISKKNLRLKQQPTKMKAQDLVMSMVFSLILVILMSAATAAIGLQFGSKYMKDKIGLKGDVVDQKDIKRVLAIVVVFWMLSAIYSLVNFNMYLLLAKIFGLKEPLKSAGLSLSK